MPRQVLVCILLSLLTILTVKAAPLDSSPTPTPIATETTTPTTVTYVVQAGENLFRIALKYGVSVDAIVQANHLASATSILVGQTLIIPGVVRTTTPTPSFTPTLAATVPTAVPHTAT